MVASFLEFFRTKRELEHHLESREKIPGENLQARITWNTSNPSKILDALEDVIRNTIDNKIHRAYGQTLLFSSVNAQVAKGYRSTATGHRRSDHCALLKELAHKRAGSVSKRELEQMVSKYLNEYYAGQKWSAIIDWFGGGGIVLIFVIAGKYRVIVTSTSMNGFDSSDSLQELEATTWGESGRTSRETVCIILRGILAVSKG